MNEYKPFKFYDIVRTRNKRPRNSIKTRNNGMLMLTNIYFYKRTNKENIRNEERFCAYQLVPYCEFRLN